MGVILRSRHFYSRAAYRQRIKSPVEFSAGLVRMLEVPRPALNPLALSAACDAQGQELFAPPNVEGWVGGPVWINSGTLLERTNWAADVVWGRAENGLTPFDPAGLGRATTSCPPTAPPRRSSICCSRTTSATRRAGSTLDAGRDGSPDGLRKALQRLANCPEFQLALSGDPHAPDSPRDASPGPGLVRAPGLRPDGPAVPGPLGERPGRRAAGGRRRAASWSWSSSTAATTA